MSNRNKSYIDSRSCIIYAIKNKLTDDMYIGSTLRPIGRWAEHRLALSRKSGCSHHCCYLQQAWDQFGEPNFQWIILEDLGAVSEHYREKREMFWIASCSTYNKEVFDLKFKEKFHKKNLFSLAQAKANVSARFKMIEHRALDKQAR